MSRYGVVMPRARRRAPETTVVCLVRHGTTPTTGKVLPGRAKGLHLADAGHAEAEAAADRLRGRDIAAVYASPLERARETAAPIAKALGHRVVVEKGLVECDFGDWTGADLGALRKLPEWQTVQRYPSGFSFPGGESFQELQGRLQATVTGLVERHPGSAIVCVSHADCIKAIVALALGVPLDLFQRIVIGPCSTTVIAYSTQGPSVLTVNSYGSPPGLAPAKAADKKAGATA
jgi:probable phosphoglycerate mutase